MIENTGLLAVVVTAVSAASIGLLSLLCLRCMRKSKVIYEENQTYDPQTFQRGGSIFAVTQSKTVTRANQITSAIVEADLSADAADDDYENVENVEKELGNLEHTYVAPLPDSIYANEETETTVTDDHQSPGVYANFIKSLPMNDDDDDYENSEFLDKVAQEDDDEPDYVNEHGECT